VIIVSAFYLMNSKFPSAQYMRWIETFLANIPCHLVFFTDQELIPLFEQMRRPHADKTRFVALPREQWTAYTRYGRSFWEHQNTIDREKAIHSADLYAIWYEKMEFVRRAINLNPFGHSRYIWCDAGAFRYPEWLPRLQTFGSASTSAIPDGKLTLLQVEPFTEDDHENFFLDRIGKFDDRNRIGGGIQAGTVDAWAKWIPLYNEKLEQRVAKGMFVGKDQTILAALVLQYPELVHRVPADRSLKDHWFTLLHVFSPPPMNLQIPFFSILIPLYNGIELLSETLESIKQQSFQDFEILIGVNGWPAKSEVYHQAKHYESQKISVLDMPECQGKAATLNALVKRAKANWIALCDADDLWTQEKLEIQHGCIHQFPEFAVLGTLGEYFGSMTGVPQLPIGDLSNEDFFKVNPLLHSSVVLRKELAEWNPDNRILEDYELWLRVRYQKKVKILNIPYVLLRHRIHPASYFNNQNAEAVPDLKARIRNELNLMNQ
jgi:hypothetical protein